MCWGLRDVPSDHDGLLLLLRMRMLRLLLTAPS